MDKNITIKNIFLLANQFLRGNEISENIMHNIKADIEIKYEISEDKESIGVMFTYSIEIPSEGDSEMPQISYSSVHFAQLAIGGYENNDENIKYIEKYIHVNVAAMIFPFIREHLATTTMKAGMTPIIIPPINFIDRYKKINSSTE